MCIEFRTLKNFDLFLFKNPKLSKQHIETKGKYKKIQKVYTIQFLLKKINKEAKP